jgi:PadR family transcriptional regulator, regulatory protein AphA
VSTARQPTTTSYALLGLLALKPWTTYELAAQMERGLNRFWPRVRSNVFEEPKRLVAMGLAKASKERVGLKTRTVYTITPKGRRVLAAWLKTPGQPPVLEWEQLVKVFFADSGTKDDVLRTLSDIAEWSREQKRHHRQRAQSYVDGEGPFPERVHIHGLVGVFLSDFAAMIGDWAEHAITTVQTWPENVAGAEPDWPTVERVARLGYNRALPAEPTASAGPARSSPPRARPARSATASQSATRGAARRHR